MPRLPSALSPLKSIIAQFQYAARLDILDTTFDCLVNQLDAAASKISKLAARCGKKDTDKTDIVADFGGLSTRGVRMSMFSAIPMTSSTSMSRQ